jgi:hypothetical protein
MYDIIIKMTERNSNYGETFIQTFDIYGKSFNLHLFGKQTYKTAFGSLFGILSIMLMASVGFYFVVDLIQRKSLIIIYNEDSSRIPVNDLSNVPIMLLLGDYNSNILNPEGLFTFDVKMMNYKRITDSNGIPKFGLEIVPIKLEKCDESKHLVDKAKYFSNLRVNSYFCIPPGKYNLTIYGKLGDMINGWSFLSIFLNRCNPKYEKCINDTIAENLLGNSALGLALLSNQVDHYNTTNPNNIKVETAILPMSSSLIKNYYYNLRQVIYDTDYGFIFEDRQVEKFYTYYSQSLDVNLKNSGLPTIGPNFGYVMIKNSEAVSNYFRSYVKGQAVMANIGGIIKTIMLIAKIITDFLTRRMGFIDISNSIFNFETSANYSKSNELNNINKNIFSNSKTPVISAVPFKSPQINLITSQINPTTKINKE